MDKFNKRIFKNQMKKTFFFAFLLFLLFAKISFSAPPPPSSGCENSNPWEEYKANSESCGDVFIFERKCWWECKDCQIKDESKNCLKWEKKCSQEEETAICNPWQKPKGKNVTEWEEREIKCEADPECFGETKVLEFRDGRGRVTSTEIHLPTKFYFKIETPDKNGWGLDCGANELKVETKNFSRILSIDEAFSLKTVPNATSDREILDKLWASDDFEKLANFLKQFTNDSSLKNNSGEMKIKTNVVKSEDKKINLEYSSNASTTFYRDYEKLRRAKENGEIKKQIEYFIHFTEEFDIKKYFHNARHRLTGETINEAYCGHKGGRNPKIKSVDLSFTLEYIYSPSQDRKVGPCKIEEGKENFVELKFCVNGNCGPANVPRVPFATVVAPEPIGILAFKRNNIKWLLEIDPKTNRERAISFEAKVTRWIDTDWNGDGWPEIPDGEADFVDFQFCGQKIDPFKPSFLFRALYRGKKIIFDPGKGCPKDPELEKLEEKKQEDCVKIDEPCICDQKPQWCEKECGKEKDGDIELDICHPVQNPESLRISKEEISNIQEFVKKNRLDEEPINCTSSYPFATTYGLFLADKEEIEIDWPDDPYYGIKELEITYPADLWKLDIYLQYFPASPILNVWQVQKQGSKYWSQKWHFKLTTEVPLKQKKQRIEKNLLKIVFEPIKKEDFETKISFHPLKEPISSPSYGERKTFNRLQKLNFETSFGRFLSFKVEIYTPDGKPIKIPLIFQQIRYRGKDFGFKKFNFWEIWPCLKYPGKENINKRRLNKPFDIYLAACKDEWGEKCVFETKIEAKTTGAPPIGLSPPPPSPAVVPRNLKINPVPGAASYIVEYDGKKQRYVKTNDFWIDVKEEKEYKWRIRSCADECKEIENENLIHCGEFSESVTFYGCPLNPPKKYSPTYGESFLPGNVTLSWDKISCDNAQVFYHLIVVYSKFSDEKREECKNLDGKEIVNETLTENTFTLSNLNCYGTYDWHVRGCLDEKCTEAGDWLDLRFNIVKEIPPSGGGFGGICEKIVPNCPPEGCGIEDFPKLIFNILNCLLWTGIPILIIIGIVTTGFTLIFLSGNVKLVERIKEIWKGIGIGILIMLFGWTILNIIFLILGWRKEIFGDWFNPF